MTGLTVPKDVFLQKMVGIMIRGGLPDYEINHVVYMADHAKYDSKWNSELETEHYIDLKG